VDTSTLYTVTDIVNAATAILGGVFFSLGVVVGMKVVFWIIWQIISGFMEVRW
jgi:hypothetical protein